MDNVSSRAEGRNFTFWLCVSSSQRQEIKFLDEKRDDYNSTAITTDTLKCKKRLT
ncbi:MAG: hypothetical protein WC974_04600 [Thermoplasmata archaeon]